MHDNLVKNYQLNRLKRHIYKKALAVLYEFFDTFDIILSSESQMVWKQFFLAL